MFETFEAELNIYEAVTYCREWFVIRAWLLENKVNISEMKEEKMFKKYDKKYRLTARAYDV